MIDWVSAFFPCVHVPLRSGYFCSISPDGEIEFTSPRRIQVEGSFSDIVQIKSCGSDGKGNATELYFHGNPAKFLQGHNIFGSDDLTALMLDCFIKICMKQNIDPCLSDLEAIQSGDYRLTRVDINYSFELPTRADVKTWLRAAEAKAKTRSGRSTRKGGTVYWGQHSKRWSIKAYCKAEEVQKAGHKLPDSLIDTPLLGWVDNKLRLEVTIRKKQLQETNLDKARDWQPLIVMKTFFGYLERLEMNEQIALTTEEFMKLPTHLKGTYTLWKDGHDLFSTLTRRTFYRHRKELKEYGINIDLVQDSSDRSNVVPLVRILEAVPVGIPEWAFELDLVHPSARGNALHRRAS